MTDDQHGEGTPPQSGGRWDPLPQGDYDDGATAFVKLPEGGIDALLAAADSPLAARGHGYVPPQIQATPGTDPEAPGAWAAPADGAQWPDPNAVPHGAGSDQFTYNPGTTQQWAYEDPARTDGGPGSGHDVTGQWSIPVANGDLPDESGEFTTSSLVQQWGGTPPATLPGGAAAPWATEGAGQPWGQETAEPTGTDGAGRPLASAAGTDTAPGRTDDRGTDTGHHAVGQAPGRPTDADPAHGHRGAPPTPGGHGREAAPEPHLPGHPEPTGHRPADGTGYAPPHAGEQPRDLRPPETEHAGREAAGADPTRPGEYPARAAGQGDPAARRAAEGYAAASDAAAAASQAVQGAREAAGAAEEAQERTEGAEGPVEAFTRPGDGSETHDRAEAAEPTADGAAPADGPDTHDTAPVSDGPDTTGAADATDDSEEPAPSLPGEEHPLASYVLRVNGVERPVSDAWIGESLLYVLRERLGLAGAKDGCSQGECGACNVQVDGRLVASCLVPAVTAAGSEVRTVEGLAEDGQPSDVQRALARCGAVQCGFCVPGMAMTVHDLLEGNPAPTKLETRQALCGNLCRCSGYRGVVDAVQEVVAERQAHNAADAEHDGDEARIPHQAGPGAGGVNPSAFDPAPHDQAYGQDGGQA
ncbi:2Fe-2S iron-sulfur cluster-binding protein [Streptomyces gilvifuscus]|uniref:2Fe-2S iron-sulfur cluster-binding protein n=1 Tax=Streptomyces gilvifuscus TaxID=1550617 RepID=A0ABT5FMN4_9ACTN|nr:2Fe-2S iron-sulfur cluster-binding protein [Streptomyces gilvifuscus]MDC2953778.1 2Fe-2S iron-sulfur cluster-binding protein [Streptomyces gilvifuscus]